ncbi:hypothetical protein VTK73DRAFT_1521 [Phialemonium thermophilum]|uniref:Uncharacterized protein n=1 Tax=Phialemonium thermophilum TaxID=223376 RepID=A0ABR3XA08_9PEZI
MPFLDVFQTPSPRAPKKLISAPSSPASSDSTPPTSLVSTLAQPLYRLPIANTRRAVLYSKRASERTQHDQEFFQERREAHQRRMQIRARNSAAAPGGVDKLTIQRQEEEAVLAMQNHLFSKLAVEENAVANGRELGSRTVGGQPVKVAETLLLSSEGRRQNSRRVGYGRSNDQPEQGDLGCPRIERSIYTAAP